MLVLPWLEYVAFTWAPLIVSASCGLPDTVTAWLMVTTALTASPAFSQLFVAPSAPSRATEVTTGAAVAFTEKLKGAEVPVLPAASVWLAVISLLLPLPIVVRLAELRV